MPQSSIIKIQFILKAKDFFFSSSHTAYLGEWRAVFKDENIHDRDFFKKNLPITLFFFYRRYVEIKMVLRAVPDLIRAQEKSAFSPVSPKGSPGDGSVSKRPCKHEDLGPIPHPQVVCTCNPSAREAESRLSLGSLPN